MELHSLFLSLFISMVDSMEIKHLLMMMMGGEREGRRLREGDRERGFLVCPVEIVFPSTVNFLNFLLTGSDGTHL